MIHAVAALMGLAAAVAFVAGKQAAQIFVAAVLGLGALASIGLFGAIVWFDLMGHNKPAPKFEARAVDCSAWKSRGSVCMEDRR